MHSSYRRTTALLMAALFVLPTNVVARSNKQTSGKPKLRNVELSKHGEVRGRVLDVHGRPVAGSDVEISTKDGKQVAMTNGDGEFKLTGLKGGVCVVHVGEAHYGARLWQQGTAPPKSLKQFSVVNDPNFVVRGQDGALFGLSPAELLSVGILTGSTAAIIIAVTDDDAS
jgi:hypothetical protein